MANTILLKGRGIRMEGPAGGSITPGHLVTVNSSGQIVVHNNAGGAALRARRSTTLTPPMTMCSLKSCTVGRKPSAS
jgi:hypothetical protein